MSDVSPMAPAPAPASKKLRAALAVSVALNLGVLGVIAGAMLHGGGMWGAHTEVRALGFGPFTEALDRSQRDALRKAVFAKAPEFRNARKAMRADAAAVVAALRAEPFDPAALSTIMAAQQQRLVGQLQLGQDLLRDLLVAMTPEARLAFADRLDARLKHAGPDQPAP